MKTIHALVFVSLIGSMITFSTVGCLPQQSADQKGDKPAAVIIIAGDEVRQLGKIKVDLIEGGGKMTPQIDPWQTGNIMIIRETTEELTQPIQISFLKRWRRMEWYSVEWHQERSWRRIQSMEPPVTFSTI